MFLNGRLKTLGRPLIVEKYASRSFVSTLQRCEEHDYIPLSGPGLLRHWIQEIENDTESPKLYDLFGWLGLEDSFELLMYLMRLTHRRLQIECNRDVKDGLLI